MLQLKAPGVYTQELPSGVRTITGAPTAVALFVGPTATGIDNRPITLFNFGDFERNFGGLSQLSNLSYSVLHFFANGGGQAVVIRIPATGAVAAANQLKAASGGAGSLSLTALSSGPAGNEIFFEIDPFDIGASPFGTSPDTTKFNLSLFDRSNGRSERFGNLSTSATSARLARTVVNDPATGSNLVSLGVLTMNGAVPAPTGTVIDITNLPVSPAAFTNAVRVILTVTPLDANGAPTTAITLDSVTVFNVGDAVPRTKQEFSARLIRALNAAIRANPNVKTALEGLEIDGGMIESGTLLRLRLGATPLTTVARINDATVTLTDKAAAPGFDSLVTMYGLTTRAANASRYQLGQRYPGTIQHAAPVVGANGATHGQPSDAAFMQAVSDLELPDPFFNILCLPDVVRPSATDPMTPQHANAMSIYAEAARICALKHAFLLVDTLPNVVDATSAEAWKSTVVSFQSNHSGAYFPYIRVDDPLAPGSIRSHPPSGAVAGVFARTDGKIGVWEAPAGTDAFIAGAYGPSVVLSDNEQGLLNPIGLNAIRQFPIFGTVSFGSRTIDGADALASEWKYIPVRRTASYILRSLTEGLRWAVHQPNGETLWAQLRMNVNAFMQTLFRQGAFKGVSIREAYFVKCDSDTTSATDINNGIVNIVIGFAPLKPAEFVVISLRQIVQANQ
jgi:phage tail sheath protein FI